MCATTGWAKWPRRALDCLFVHNWFVLSALALALALAATLDAFNSRITTLYNWRAATSFSFCLAALSAVLLFIKHASNSSPLWTQARGLSYNKDAASMAMLNEMPMAQREHTPKTEHITRQRKLAEWHATVAIVLTVLLGGAAAAAIFLYEYTRGTDGYQAAVDEGYQTGGPLLWVWYHKLVMLHLLQAAGLAVVVMLYKGFTLRRLYPGSSGLVTESESEATK